jgi:hypothetical protein
MSFIESFGSLVNLFDYIIISGDFFILTKIKHIMNNKNNYHKLIILSR